MSDDDDRTLAETLSDAWENGADAAARGGDIEDAEQHAFDRRDDDEE